MFTEGLDESAISWIKQGREAKQEPPQSPLAEKFELPRSPLGLTGGTYASSYVLPPLKFHKTVALSVDDSLEDSYSDDEDDESVGSASNESGTNYSDEEGPKYNDLDYLERPLKDTFSSKENRNSLQTISASLRSRPVSTLNKGNLKDELHILLPKMDRKFRDSELGFGSCRTRESSRLPSTYATPTSNGTQNDFEDFRTPSAPPIFDIGGMAKQSEAETERSEDTAILEAVERDFDGSHMPKESKDGLTGSKERSCGGRVQYSADVPVEGNDEAVTRETEGTNHIREMNSLTPAAHYNTSYQHAWQTLISYDASVRLCLNAWAKGCTEAPEFLRDECLILRSAFGLHRFLLQPRGSQPIQRIDSASKEQIYPLKINKVVGKLRVEVKKLRVIRRRELKSTLSQRSQLYMQVGAEYVRHVSAIVKTRINSLRSASFAVTPEERLSCVFHLKSSVEDSQGEPASTICLRPGTGAYHDFFPENQSDALILEIQDTKGSIQGQAIISVASLTENQNDRIRWWPLYHNDDECVGKIQLSIGSTITADETSHIKGGTVVETLAYDLLLESAMRSQQFHARSLRLDGPWKWLLGEFADYYGVSDSYTKLRYLSYVMNVATPTKDCLELVHELLEPIIKARSERSLTRQEKGILLDCESQVENLLAAVFENYKSLDENSPTGLLDSFGSIPDVAAPAIAHAMKVYTLLHDILSQDAQTTLRNYLQTAAAKRCRKHMVETDEFVLNNEGLLMDSMTYSTAYLKMKKLCISISNEIQADIKIHNQDILPSSIDLSSITATIYSTELCKRLRGFLATWPPSSPSAHVNELLIATADFERNLQQWNISPGQGGVDSRNLFHNYIMVWVQDMQLSLLDLCKAEKVPWSGVLTNHSTSPFAEEMYEKIKQMLTEYVVVMTRWPQYSLVLENAVANVERSIVKALEKQYHDILTPLKDSIPKRLGMKVQKLTRRQSTALYSVPSHLGTFLITIKRILDVLHCKVEDILKSWASNIPVIGDKKTLFGEQMNGVTVLLRTKYKTYSQATIEMLVNNMQGNRSTRLKRILEETKEADGESEVRERMQMLNSQLIDSISNLHEVFTSQIFVATSRGFWDRMGQVVLRFLEGRKENRVWYNGSYYALGILDDTFASQMQRLQGNALQEKDLEPPRSIIEARSILSRDSTNATDTSSYMYF